MGLLGLLYFTPVWKTSKIEEHSCIVDGKIEHCLVQQVALTAIETCLQILL